MALQANTDQEAHGMPKGYNIGFARFLSSLKSEILTDSYMLPGKMALQANMKHKEAHHSFGRLTQCPEARCPLSSPA